jgi:hypothetical protein
LQRAIVSALAILLGILAAAPLQAADPVRVDRPSFVFELPPDWEALSKDGPMGMESYNFYDLGGDVVQLRVSKALAPRAYATARKSAQAEAREDRTQDGWKLSRARMVKLPPLGEVDESVRVDPENPLTSYSYTVFGPGRIASITITFNRRDLSASESARKIVRGLRWKKATSQGSPAAAGKKPSNRR